MSATATTTTANEVKAESLGWKASMQKHIHTGLALISAGASKVVKGARWFARHLLVKILMLALLAMLLVGFIWLAVWIGMSALAVSPWLLAAYLFFTAYVDYGVIGGILKAGYKVIVADTATLA